MHGVAALGVGRLHQRPEEQLALALLLGVVHEQPRVHLLGDGFRGPMSQQPCLLLRLVEQGAGVLLISSEIEELTGMCDRILVMAHGQIRDCLSREQFDHEQWLRSALGEERLQ